MSIPCINKALACFLSIILPQLLIAQKINLLDLQEKIEFERIEERPFIPLTNGTFFSVLAANPAVTEFKGLLYFVFRGQDEKGHDQIGMWTTPAQGADGIKWEIHYPYPVIPVSIDSMAPDNNHILDPGLLVMRDSLFVYYTGKSTHSDPEYSICLSVMGENNTFEKSQYNPIIRGAIAPEVILFNGLIYIFYQRLNPGGFWEVFVSESTDGVNFNVENERKVFGPSGIDGTFDSYSIATVRIFREGDYFYMTYAACSKYIDYPESIGLARSPDLLEWERYQGNPIFTRGDAGSWDEGAVWFPTVRKFGDSYVMWYEGAGTGLGTGGRKARKASRLARAHNYGGYLSTSFSQIGIAIFEGNIIKMFDKD